MRRTEALKAITRVLKQPVEGVPAADLIYGRALAHIENPTGDAPPPWAMQVDVLSLRIAAELPLTDDADAPPSPLAQAEDAKRRRDLVGEVGALMDGYARLTTAPWYPARPGDLVHVHHEAGALPDPFGETYIIRAAAQGFLSLQLLANTMPEAADTAGLVGCYAVEDDPDPLTDLWMEAGPHRLTVIRDGRVVHDGAAPRAGAPEDAGVRRRVLARAVADTKRYLQRGEPELALARLRSPGPLPPCGTPGPMLDHQPCARPRGHGGAHSPDADFREGPHECPALPEQLHAVVTVDADCAHVSVEGLYEAPEAAVDVAAGHEAYREEHTAQSVREYDHGTVTVVLPDPRQLRRIGVQMAVVVPLRVLPDPRAEEEWAAEGRATCMEPDPDYGRDLDDE